MFFIANDYAMTTLAPAALNLGDYMTSQECMDVFNSSVENGDEIVIYVGY